MNKLSILVIILFCFIIQENLCANDLKNYTVINFYQQSDISEFNWLSKGLADLFIDSLKSSGIQNIVERENMQTILNELELADKGLVESSNLQKIGGLLKVTDVIYGFYNIEQTEIEINILVFNIETEKIYLSINIKGQYNNLIELINSLSDKLINALAGKDDSTIKNFIPKSKQKIDANIFTLKNYFIYQISNMSKLLYRCII